MNKRALVFVSGYRPEVFGISRYVPQYVDALADAGWSVDVCAPYPFYPAWRLDRSLPRVSTECNGRVRVTRYAPFVPRRPSAFGRGMHEISIALQALRLVPSRVGAADLVVAASPPPLGAACTVRIANRYHKPCIVLAYDLATDLASDTFGLAGRTARSLFGAVESRLYARASRVIALTDDMATRIRLLAKYAPSVAVIRIWADDELFQLDHAAAARAFRDQLGIPASCRLVGYAGNFGTKQRLPEIVRAIRALPQDFTAVFVGDGPDRQEMERLASGASGDLRIVPPYSTADLHAFLSACDLSIVTAWTKHAGTLFPSKVANILAAGCPILAITDPDTELATLLEREDLGLTCPSLDPAQIANAVRRGVEFGRARERRARCQRYAETHFNRAHAMTRFLAEVDQLVMTG